LLYRRLSSLAIVHRTVCIKISRRSLSYIQNKKEKSVYDFEVNSRYYCRVIFFDANSSIGLCIKSCLYNMVSFYEKREWIHVLVALGCYFISVFLSYDKCVQNWEVLGSLYPIADSQSTDLKNLLYDKNTQMKYLFYFFFTMATHAQYSEKLVRNHGNIT